MNRSVNISKISPPYLPPILYRSRLLDLLEKNKDKKLILILGQAAQGKSTLAASYIKTSKIPSAWMNLDKEDSDPFNLFYLIVQSLQDVLKAIDFSPFLSYSSEMIGPRYKISLFREWTHSIFEKISIPIQIVIDGLDRVTPDGQAFEFLQMLIEESPSNIHLLLLSREIPPLSLEFQHLKIRQDALVLTNEELAFTEEEIKDFFQKIRKISFNKDQIEKIFFSTEGWIGGLILFAETLSRHPEIPKDRFISETLPDHFKRELFQYFGKEILSAQPNEVQQFLIKSSLIDLIEPDFIKEFIGTEGAEEILRDHVRKNLFVRSFYDDKKGWLFRYHQLFRGFLKAKLKSTLPDEERRYLLLKAATLYEQRNELESSLKHFFEAEAYSQAASAIERLGMNLLRSGRGGDLSKWILALPQEIREGNPWILFYCAMARRFTGVKENISDLQKALQLFKQSGDVRGYLLSLAFLIENLILKGHYTEPIASLIKEGENLLTSTESHQLIYERAVLWLQIGLGRIRVEGNVRTGILACQTAYLMAKQLKDVNLQINALILTVLGFAYLGEFLSGKEASETIEKLLEESTYPEMQSVHLLAMGALHTNAGDFTKAERHIQQLEGLVNKYGLVYMYPMILSFRVLLGIYLGKFDEAQQIGKRLLDTTETVGNLFLKGLSLGLMGLGHYHTGDFHEAKRYAQEAIAILSSDDARSGYPLYRKKQMMGLIACHMDDFQMAQKELEEALAYFVEQGSHLSIAETHLGLALLHRNRGENDGARHHLEAGFEIAQERNYRHFLILSPKDLMKACLLAIELQVPKAMDHAVHLLSTRLSHVGEEELEKLSSHPDAKIREKIWEIRRAIHRSKVPLLRIETLGGFRVFRGDSSIREGEWDRSQPKKLLKTIVSYGGQRIPKEILIDELWPEERPQAAEKNFKTTLQRLRKSLEPVIDKEFSSSYIHLHENFVFLDPEFCQVDVDLFLSLLKKGGEKEKEGDIKAALSFYTEATEIYKGDFLPEEVYAPWADKRREALKIKYIELLNKMANIHEKQGAIKRAIDFYKKIIQADPLLEESYQKLMTLYFSKGMHNEALKTYEACKKALRTELKSKPDTTTEAIYNKILEKTGVSRPTKTKGSNGKK